MILERADQDMVNNFAEEDLADDNIQMARSRTKRQQLVVGLVKILAGTGLSDWVNQSLMKLQERVGIDPDEGSERSSQTPVPSSPPRRNPPHKASLLCASLYHHLSRYH